MTNLPGYIPVIADVTQERIRQDNLWGQQDHVPVVWSAILGEEFGEFMQAVNAHHFELVTDVVVSNLRDEAIQVAAVAIAFVEALDRNNGWAT